MEKDFDSWNKQKKRLDFNENNAIISQIRLIDTKRLVNQIGFIDQERLCEIKKTIRNLFR